MVAHKRHKPGDAVFCRVCGSGFVLEKQEKGLGLKPTMQKGRAEELQAFIDHDLLPRLLENAAPYLPIKLGGGNQWLRRLRQRLQG